MHELLRRAAQPADDAPLDELVDRATEIPDEEERHDDDEHGAGDAHEVRVDAHRTRPLAEELAVQRHLQAVLDEPLVRRGAGRGEQQGRREPPRRHPAPAL